MEPSAQQHKIPPSANEADHFDPNQVLKSCLWEHKQRSIQLDSSASSAQQLDLHWILHSPELLDLHALIQAQASPLIISCFSRPPIDQHPNTGLNADQQRLGLYAEDLLAQYLSSTQSEHILIAKNLQVRSEGHRSGRTIGEFDFITQHKISQRYQHIEMACKFYLGLPSPSHGQVGQWSRWLGPNCNDRLDLKVNKFVEHQLLLSQQPAAQQRMQDLGISPIDVQYLLRGRLFYPAFTHMPEPIYSAERHLKGLWICHSESRRFRQALAQQWGHWNFRQLNKLEFLAPRLSGDYYHRQVDWERFTQYIDDYFLSQSRSTHKDCQSLRPLPLSLSPTAQNNSSVSTTELRLFVVPDNWPQIASTKAEATTPL